jgi:hypothetical protein
LNPQVFIAKSNQRNPGRIMNLDLNLLLNRLEEFILGGIQKKLLDPTQE